MLLALALSCYSPTEKNDRVDFNTQVRPILNRHCLSCHGGVKQLGELSFLFEEEAYDTTASGGFAIVPGNANVSELIHRIEHQDPEIRMPPEQSPLKKADIETLKKWINQGAKWGIHWAYRLPIKTVPPEIKSPKGFPIQNPIDQFVLQKMQEKGLLPSEQIEKAVLLRRVSLDLVGLPPSLEEWNAFLSDNSTNAYEKAVDRLLVSPRFGERWASVWMDLARYGDSQGYQKDPYRSIWLYRDWLIKAFNDDMPFDQFTIEQLAGDLLPEPDESQFIATAFHRNTMTNDEGGTDDEEFRVAAVLDRVNTTWEVWQGSTMACVQCHSHPYDPIWHEEYYESFAFFNNTMDSDKHDDRPYINTYPQEKKVKLARLTAHVEGIDKIEPNMKSEEIEKIRQHILELPDQIDLRNLKDSIASIKPIRTPIMQELSKKEERTSHLFERGNWLVHGKEVHPSLPKSLLQENVDLNTQNRLDLANWLVSAENPLTARVTVNRFWAELFGQGIVKTLEDFGTQGDAPTHPALLDWLAVHFREDLDWSMKKLLRMIVLSSTYQQSSIIEEKHLEIDPRNKYLSRMSRVRLSAEQIRDQALAVSGLLSDKMYGPSVMPPQPEGVWQVIRNVLRWEESEGEDRYRRALYTFWRRSSPYPAFLTFDSPGRELCVSRRIRTNTPLQALTTLNDTVYMEAARALGKSMYEYMETNVEDKINYGYQRALLKKPNTQVLAILKAQYIQNLAYYRKQKDLAIQMSLTEDASIAAELSAWAVTANIILNLDDILVKE